MKISSIAAVMAFSLMAGSGAAWAQAATPSAPAATTAPMASATDKKAVAAKCSAEADQKKLHGKARKTFRSQCKRDAAK